MLQFCVLLIVIVLRKLGCHLSGEFLRVKVAVQVDISKVDAAAGFLQQVQLGLYLCSLEIFQPLHFFKLLLLGRLLSLLLLFSQLLPMLILPAHRVVHTSGVGYNLSALIFLVAEVVPAFHLVLPVQKLLLILDRPVYIDIDLVGRLIWGDPLISVQPSVVEHKVPEKALFLVESVLLQVAVQQVLFAPLFAQMPAPLGHKLVKFLLLCLLLFLRLLLFDKKVVLGMLGVAPRLHLLY
mmetsp:Transcript_10132/g.30979  ORF Transcript_10132/g.30979 Transcript_10132/m.30979 type:complete len:238 (+) Transcript_10132:1226-1939(+)